MPDLNAVIRAHNTEMHRWWRDPRHIAARETQIKKHPLCFRCGRKAVLILHEYPDDYQHGFDHYLALIVNEERPTGCAICNQMERSGRWPCPDCVKKYQKDPTVKIHYITHEQERCRYCEPEYDPEAIRLRKERALRTKRKSGRDRYNKAHPTIKVPVNGTWVQVRR
jgi:hypothetical protein